MSDYPNKVKQDSDMAELQMMRRLARQATVVLREKALYAKINAAWPPDRKGPRWMKYLWWEAVK